VAEAGIVGALDCRVVVDNIAPVLVPTELTA